MKKKYFAPQTQLKTVIVKNRMLAGSDPQVGISNETVNAADVESRENSFIQPSSVWED